MNNQKPNCIVRFRYMREIDLVIDSKHGDMVKFQSNNYYSRQVKGQSPFRELMARLTATLVVLNLMPEGIRVNTIKTLSS